MFAGLDDQTKEKAKSILEQEKSGKLTREQVKEELTKLEEVAGKRVNTKKCLRIR